VAGHPLRTIPQRGWRITALCRNRPGSGHLTGGSPPRRGRRCSANDHPGPSWTVRPAASRRTACPKDWKRLQGRSSEGSPVPWSGICLPGRSFAARQVRPPGIGRPTPSPRRGGMPPGDSSARRGREGPCPVGWDRLRLTVMRRPTRSCASAGGWGCKRPRTCAGPGWAAAPANRLGGVRCSSRTPSRRGRRGARAASPCPPDPLYVRHEHRASGVLPHRPVPPVPDDFLGRIRMNAALGWAVHDLAAPRVGAS
jgi:hypothetical protein